MESYLIDLINRMSKKEREVNSADSVSWKAHREAEALDDKRFITQLIDYLPFEKDKTHRGSAYFVLGKLLAKFTDNNAIQFFINRLQIETDKYILSRMLDRLAKIDKDKSIDITPILHCTENDKWLIRHSAISALEKTRHEAAKEKVRTIVQLDDHKKNKNEIIYAVAVLGMIGEKEDIALLKPLFSSRIRDIKDSAQFAAETLG